MCYLGGMGFENTKIGKEAKEAWARMTPEQQEEAKRLLAEISRIDDEIDLLRTRKGLLEIKGDYAKSDAARMDLEEAKKQKDALLDQLVRL